MPPIPTENLRSPAALARFLVPAAGGLALDLWSKLYAFRHLAAGVDAHGRVVGPQPPYVIIPDWLQLEVTTNKGAVFGLGQGMWPFFVIVSIAAIGFLGYLFATSGRQRIVQVVLGMLLAGVLGNLYDRAAFGYVRDMIHMLPGWPNLFPWIFNVADSLLCVGVGAMMLLWAVGYRTAPAPANAGKPARSR